MTESEMKFWNVHDVFLNCSLLRKLMAAAPVEKNPEEWSKSDRARLERLWHGQLYVLVEAWRAADNAATVAQIGREVDCAQLTAALASATSAGFIDRLRETRHYMSHRDRRDYNDPGRSGPVGWLVHANQLHQEFSAVFLSKFARSRLDLLAEGAAGST